MEILVDENRQLKNLLDSSSKQAEELRENNETLKLLEEETQEENDVLKYKVKSLEESMDRESSDHDSIREEFRIVDELNDSKHELQVKCN